MKYNMEYFGKTYEIDNIGDGGILINGEEHYCPLNGDLEYGCKDCADAAEYKYNPVTGNCEEL